MLSSLFLNFGIDYSKAQQMRRSDVHTIFESKAFGDWKKSQEANQKLQAAIVERLDIAIKSISGLGKALSRR